MSMIGNFQRATDAEIAHLLASPDEIVTFLYGSDESESRADLDIDKAWHGLHYLLTGTAWAGDPPLNFLVSGGARIGDVEVGYDSARAFTSAEVRQIAAELALLSEDDLRRRFDPVDMEEQDIYPNIWSRPASEDDTLGYLIEYFWPLRDYVETLSRDGLGMLVYIN